ncbi:MAG: hypothetical protein ACRBK7_02430 [Acidimicrobiales bacterium]
MRVCPSPTGRSFSLRPSRSVLPLLVAATIVAGCSLPVSDQVETLPASEHRELLDGTTSTTVLVAEPGESSSPPVKLFFIGPDDKLEAVVRPLPEDSVNNDVLRALEQGPIETEIAQFETLQTFVPDGLAAQFGTVDKDRGSMPLIVDPGVELRRRVEEEPDQGRLIISQLVCTVLSLNLNDVLGVEIFDGGEEAIPLSDNAAQPIIGPAQAEDFDSCITGTEERQEQLEEQAENQASTTTLASGNG